MHLVAIDIADCIATLPSEVLAILAKGPIDEDVTFLTDESCRVCQALRPYAKRPTYAMYFLAEWHNVHNSPEEWYLRCLVIYMMSGWDGCHAIEI